MTIKERINRNVTIVDLEMMRKASRFMAKVNRNRGNYDKVKKWNDFAYLVDCAVVATKENC